MLILLAFELLENDRRSVETSFFTRDLNSLPSLLQDSNFIKDVIVKKNTKQNKTKQNGINN